MASFVRAYANLANEMPEAGYAPEQAEDIKREAAHYEKVRQEVKIASRDYVDMKSLEPAMRHLLDAYIRASESEKVSAFDEMGLVELLVEEGKSTLDKLPRGTAQRCGGDVRDHREQPPQGHSRRAAGKPEVLQ